MAAINLDKMNLDELKKLQKDVNKAVATYEDRQRKEALEAAEKAAREMGFSLSELTGAKLTKGRKPAAAAKYRHPENPELTWSGRGRRPAWITEAVNEGKSIEDYAI